MKCLNCEEEVTEAELLLNDDCCPHCGHEHDQNDTTDDTAPWAWDLYEY